MKLLKITLALLFVISLTLPMDAQADPNTLNGAGATFPYPLYAQWAYKYNQLTGVKLNYQSIGSGGGIRQIQAKTVDFGASDAPLKSDELDEHGLLQFPMIIGGVVPVVNVKGVAGGQLKLDGPLLADIFQGKIKKWNDPRIQALNSDLKLPKKDIAVIHRADGSGTTWIFTKYLAEVSPTWESEVGAGKAVSWPVGYGGKGNEGVSSYVMRIDGAIGYVEYAYALQNQMAHVTMKNKDGGYVNPTADAFAAAAANADWEHAPGFYLVLVDQPGEDSWPISGASFILMYKDQSDGATAKSALSFFDWSFKHGDEIADKLHYVPIPDNVVEMIQNRWRNEIKANGKPVWE